MSAETGVGPAMASGSQTKSGICADLPVAPMNMRATTHGTHVGTEAGSVARAKSRIGPKSSVPSCRKTMNIASRKAKSPTRLTTNALVAAAEFLSSVYQNPMSRYEHTPTPSHPRKSTGKLSPSTRLSMAKMKRLR